MFDDLITVISKWKNDLFSRFRGAQRPVRTIVFSVLGVVSVFLCLVLSGTTVAYRVSMDGKPIATVKDKQAVAAAVDLVSDALESCDVSSALSAPEFTVTLARKKELNDRDEIASSILFHNSGIVMATALKVNGETVACGDAAIINELLESRKNAFSPENTVCSSEFVDQIELQDGYMLAEDLNTAAELRSVIESLNVMTMATIVTETPVPFEHEEKEVNTRLKGDTAIVNEGQDGVMQTVEKVLLLNDAEMGRTEVSSGVIIQPVNEVVEIGTAASLASAEERARAYESGFIFPLPTGSWVVSAYFGDGRGHKGIDLAASSGTPIYSVADGVVVEAGPHSGYGNYVIVEHENGLRTRYAHASRLCVQVGTPVVAGEVVGFVGSTGDSTGNHLHFEVMFDGSCQNPAPYIGLD